MPSKRMHNKHKHKRNSLSDWLFVIVLFLFFLLFAAFTTSHVLTYTNITSDNLSYYNGNYQLRKLRYHRNTVYCFELNNGDSVEVKPELMQHFDSHYFPDVLSFAYTDVKTSIDSSYTAVEIRSEDTVFLSMDSSLREARMGTIAGALFAMLVLSVLVLFAIHSFPTKKRVNVRKAGGRFYGR